MQTKWYLILVLTAVWAASVISISVADEDASDGEEDLADEDVSAQDQSIAPAGKPAPIVCYPECLDGQICKRGVCIDDRKACDDNNPCTTGDTTVKGKCHGTPVADGTECTDDNGNTGECSNGQCCGEDQLNCGGICVYEADPKNCFACNNVCADNQICDAPNYDPNNNPNPCIDCSTIGEGYTACTISEDPIAVKTCVDTSSDLENCGVCGKICGDTESCVDSKCSICSEPTPQVCTLTYNGVTETACCDTSDTCAWGFGGDDSWHTHTVCCPEDQLFDLNQCCPEGTHPYTSDAGWTSCEIDSCKNFELDPGEGDVDCGGDAMFGTGCNTRCENGQTCLASGDNDCASYYCNAGICEPCTEATGCHDYGYTCTEGVCEYTG